MTFRALLLSGAVGLAGLAIAVDALAQSAPPAASPDRLDDAYDLGELVVTARDREG